MQLCNLLMFSSIAVGRIKNLIQRIHTKAASRVSLYSLSFDLSLIC